MSQPPYGPPPGQYVYGQPPYGYGPPVYGQAPPPQPPPRKPSLVPWLIVGGSVLLSGLGVLLVVLLRGHAPDTPNAATTSTSATSSTAASRSSPAPGSPLPGGAQVADRNTGGQARFGGSDQVALSWVQAMADGDYQTAYDLSCADVRQSALDAAAGGDPAEALGNYFFGHTLSGQGITDGSFDSIIYSQQADSDIASFTLQLDDGEEFLLLVYVQGDGTICDFI